MKQMILTGILTCFYMTVSAQSLTINEYGNSTDISGTVFEVNLGASIWNEHLVDFMVNNLTGSGQNWMITRYIVSQPAGWGNYFCWGAAGAQGQCYDPSTDTYYESDLETIPAGSSGVLSTYFSTDGGGCSHIRYYVSTDGVNFIDSVDMQVCFNLGVNELNGLQLSVGPNPAQTSVLVQSENLAGGTLQVVDALGRMVRTEEVILPYNLDVSSLENGTYFLQIAVDETQLAQQKLIVRH
jgi:hypothetical protein